MSDTQADGFVDALQKNLFNTNHFTVVGPQELAAHSQDLENPSDVDCHDIACGIKIGKELNADKVMVGQINLELVQGQNAETIQLFTMSVRLLNVLTNSLDFSDEIQFNFDTMQDQLFELATRISNNTVFRGQVLSVNNKNIVIDLGKAHGLKIRDRIVVYTQTSTSDLEGQTLGLEQKNIAIAEVNRLNDTSSNAIVLYKYEPIDPGALVKTYVNRHKQVDLIAETRRELDTRKRMARPTRPLVLKPEVIDNVTGEPIREEKQRWQRRMAAAEANQKRWMYYGIGAGVGMALLLTKRVDLGDFHTMAVVGGGAASGYLIYKYFQTRNQINALQAEGRVKKFLSFQYDFNISPQGINVSLNYKF
ncbi:MAG: hypothetical protein HQM13_16065 [SAR324 cluster bacterium]|nr:hypothetical protein [SAR324 cluster bacterium]